VVLVTPVLYHCAYVLYAKSLSIVIPETFHLFSCVCCVVLYFKQYLNACIVLPSLCTFISCLGLCYSLCCLFLQLYVHTNIYELFRHSKLAKMFIVDIIKSVKLYVTRKPKRVLLITNQSHSQPANNYMLMFSFFLVALSDFIKLLEDIFTFPVKL